MISARAAAAAAGMMTSFPHKSQVYLVTGSTDGIGRHTAQKLAQGGATVLVHGRDEERVLSTVDKIKKATANEDVHGYTFDLASLEEVRGFAAAVSADYDHLDVLINNAGVFENFEKKSKDGFEMTWAVNVLAPFLLTSLLLDKVTSRIVNVSSLSARNNIDFNNLQQENGYSEHGAYALSKLCSQIFTMRLAEILKDITVNCLDPGTVNTKMLLASLGPIGIEVQDADGEYFAATHPSLSQTTAKYFVDKRETDACPAAYDKGIQDKLWSVLGKQTGAKY